MAPLSRARMADNSRKGVIVVSMDYRLSIFGFFSHPELPPNRRSTPPGTMGSWTNRCHPMGPQKYQVFGGDPNNVTIFGESAGSFSVSAQMASPLAKDLFQHAIGESGSIFRRNSSVEIASSDRKGQPEIRRVGPRYILHRGTASQTRCRNSASCLEAGYRPFYTDY